MNKSDIINEILREYDLKQGIALEKKQKETEKAYKECPELENTDKKINELGLNSMRKILADKENAAKLKQMFEKELENLNSKRKELIKAFKINPDYNKPVYECEKCSDTGFSENGVRCTCFEEKIKKKLIEKSQMGNMLETDDFSKFNLSYYSDEPNSGGSPREIVSEALECSKNFCADFENEKYNLYFYGNTGLGKTFLSSIIARNVLNKGKTVKYARATSIFTLYDDYKFNDYGLKEKIDELYNCELLVIDDLGTENINKNGISFLFDLVNDRLINGKRMIINTNLDIAEFSQRYTVRLTSRIYENFRIFCFKGNDIRIKKLMEQ